MFILNETNYSDGKATFYDNEGAVVSGGTLRIYRGDSLVSTNPINASGSASFSIDKGVFYRFEIVSGSGELVSILDPVMYEGVDGGSDKPGEDYGEEIDELGRKLDAEAQARKEGDERLAEDVAAVEQAVATVAQAITEGVTDAVSFQYFDVFNESDEIVIRRAGATA